MIKRKLRKEDSFVIFVAVTFLIIVVIIILVTYRAITPSNKVNPIIIPTPKITVVPTQAHDIPLVVYDDNAQTKLLEKVIKRKTLSKDDLTAKEEILFLLPSGEVSGILYKSPAIRIEYNHAPDVFQVEILTTDIEKAKAEANFWFRSFGMSQDAICNYPVEFYMSSEVRYALRNSDIIFNPLAKNCL